MKLAYFVWLAAVLLLNGCAPAIRPGLPADMMVIPAVPEFQAQSRNDDCAGVALASLLGHAGFHVSPAVIDQAVYEPKLGGALLADLEKFAATAGAKPQSGRGSVPDLRRLIRSGRPLLVPIDLGWNRWRRPHYIVAYGVSDDEVLMHVRQGETRTMTMTDFDQRWAALGRLYLYLEP